MIEIVMDKPRKRTTTQSKEVEINQDIKENNGPVPVEKSSFKFNDKCKGLFLVIVLLLAVQFLMGYYLNVYTNVSDTNSLVHQAVGNATPIFSQFQINASCLFISEDIHSAIKRAKTQACRQKMAEVGCLHERKELYPKSLKSHCPRAIDEEVRGRYLGCFQDSFNERLLGGSATNLAKDNEKEVCIKLCFDSGYGFAGLQYRIECFCGNEIPSTKRKIAGSKCDKRCPGDENQPCGGYLTMNVYQTGVVPLKPRPEITAVGEDKVSSKKVRIVFLLTISGRAVRQVKRMLKVIYHVNHYYLIHIDSRQDLMYRELSGLELMYPNIRIARQRHPTIWGGASLLQMLLDCFKELLTFTWQWDFVLNLSESDFPLKSIQKLETFLSLNKQSNFVKSSGRETNVFIRKQGLDRTFLECENRMWRMGKRDLPHGLQIDGGSDWISLSKEFVRYLSESFDDLVTGLNRVFKYSLLPAESFFHMALKNSKFCATVINNNLHFTNWRRKQGCKCQHKAVVDWCGCSPNDLKPTDWEKITTTSTKQIFFGRKFEPVVNQEIINRVEQWILGSEYDQYRPGINDYWQNIYHHLDESPKPRPEDVSLAYIVIQDFILRNLTGFELEKVLEITIYNNADEFQGILIMASVLEKLEQEITIVEVLVKVRETKSVVDLGGNALTVSVGTDYDPKEVLFRNYFNAFGPESKVSLALHFEENSTSNHDIKIEILNPEGDKVFELKKSLNGSGVEDNFNLDIANSMLPGIWKVKVLERIRGDVKEEFEFLVMPILEKYISNFRNLENNHHEAFDISKEATRLASQFYEVKHFCIVGEEDKGDSKLTKCSSQHWSSRAKDPKSTIHGINRSTGRFF